MGQAFYIKKKCNVNFALPRSKFRDTKWPELFVHMGEIQLFQLGVICLDSYGILCKLLLCLPQFPTRTTLQVNQSCTFAKHL